MTKDVCPLPDIVIPDDLDQSGDSPVDDRTEIQVTPTITFEDDNDDNKDINERTPLSGVTSAQISELNDDDTPSPDPADVPAVDVSEAAAAAAIQQLAKNYTVEEGFERPWDNIVSTESVCGTEDNIDEASDISDDDSDDGKSSSSSSFPSESSGIFYKAEYTPPPPSSGTPVNNLLSIENRDIYWRNFFSRNSSDATDNPLKKSRSGCNNHVTDLSDTGPVVSKSKSDAKIGYSSTVLTETEIREAAVSAYHGDKCQVIEEQDETVTNIISDADIEHNQQETQDIEPVIQEADEKKPEGQLDEVIIAKTLKSPSKEETFDPSIDEVVIARTLKSPLKEETFDLPWTETGGDSPRQVTSGECLSSSTISREMQDLLTSIQSLGSSDQSAQVTQQSKQKSPVRLQQPELTLREKNVDFESLMKEVENQIRFSVTAELLERMTNCPSIENYFLSGLNNSVNNTSEPAACTDTYVGSPPIPDLLQTTVKNVSHERPVSTKMSTSRQSPPSDSHRKRYTSLPRPSDMSGVTRYPVTGMVPDMWSRVQCPSDDMTTDVVSDLSRVRHNIDNLCDIISSNDKEGSPSASNNDHNRCSGKFQRKLENDLQDTRDVMKDIEQTVDSFRRHLSLPSGRVSY